MAYRVVVEDFEDEAFDYEVSEGEELEFDDSYLSAPLDNLSIREDTPQEEKKKNRSRAIDFR